MSSRFQRGDDLGKIILEIIKDYPTITTTDIWYELWQNEKIPYGKINRSGRDLANTQYRWIEIKFELVESCN